MIPEINFFSQPQTPQTLTYKLNMQTQSVLGNVDKLEAVKQAVFKILQTERYSTPIYSADYGVELADLYGMPKSYVKPELERRITDALTQDERIISVSDFTFSEVKKGEILINFTVKTIYGEFNEERSVRV